MNTVLPPPLPTKTIISKTSDVSAPTGLSQAKGVALLPINEEDEPKTYYLEVADQASADDSDDNMEYEDIAVEQFDDYSDSDVDETLDQAVRNIHEKDYFGISLDSITRLVELTPTLTKHPEVIDDYIRNYLSSKGLVKSLETFQNEWYEFQQKERLAPEDITIVPNVYQKNQELSDALQKLRVDVETYKDIASKARATYDKLRKERDFHRMHHKRVVQEKNKLISDIKRLKKHYENYEPTLKQLQHKYEIAMKEKMLTKIERDRLISKVVTLEDSVKNAEVASKGVSKSSRTSAVQREIAIPAPLGSTRTTPAPQDGQQQAPIQKKSSSFKEAVLLADVKTNPFISTEFPTPKYESFKQIHQVKGHTLAISSLKFHPKKPILASVSDDRSWKMWAFPSGELIMSGEGHKDWIADCDFHPRGTQLATASGDGTVKLWDFSKGIATLTMSDHTQAVWSCAFHDHGDFLASSSMDHTAKLWDIHTGKCRQTFRGHTDSVNQVGWQPFTNTLFTCSGDKTISLWDGRTGVCTQTLFGHLNAINSGCFSIKGNRFASCDADGIVKLWDLRNTSELASMNMGPHAANKVAFDPSGEVLAVASNNGSARLINVNDSSKSRDIKVYQDSVQTVVFDRTSEYMVTAGSDGMYQIFQ
ncbi:hypothetical protein BDV3_005487 [Batrachochytrium dendrobatidis]|uniref:Uncharacterized protein n=1 Tax=Batrachochytrium dendrobatidis (strain JEL423) TaxID=403673 RepID=A0A177WIV9_BATDL|nr:hypothetical protein BDEG_23545 [Batrachochytrium dendrobatidis JEL423]